MLNTKRIISYVFIILVFSACGDDDTPLSERERIINLLEGTWTVDENKGIQLDGLDITEQFTDFQLTIANDLSYAILGADFDTSPWASDGNFILSDDLSQLIRDDGLEVGYIVSEDGNSMSLSFIFNETNNHGGRSRGIIGDWSFGLKK